MWNSKNHLFTDDTGAYEGAQIQYDLREFMMFSSEQFLKELPYWT